MGFAKFEIYPNGPHQDVWVNEQKVEGVIAYQLSHEQGSAPRLALVTLHEEGVVQGEGIVEIRSNADATILSRISSLNPALVEEKALESLGWGDSGNLTAAIISTIVELLRADQPEGRTDSGGEAAPG